MSICDYAPRMFLNSAANLATCSEPNLTATSTSSSMDFFGMFAPEGAVLPAKTEEKVLSSEEVFLKYDKTRRFE